MPLLPPDDAVLNEFEAAEALGLAVTTLRMWRHRKMGPPFRKMGKTVRYLGHDLRSYLDSVSVNFSGEPTDE